MYKKTKITMEEWRKIPGIPENYEISNLGRLRNLKSNKIWDTYSKKPNGTGYILHGFTINGKRTSYGFHVLVALAFLPNPDNLPTVDHIDRDQRNCNVNNLRWASWETQFENRKNYRGSDNVTSKLKEEQVKDIRQKYKNGISQGKLANEYNVGQSLISLIISGKRWSHL